MFLLKTYKLKFTQYYISKLNGLVNNIYNKNITFNFVDLKKMHLNSDIFTQAVALKLRNRDNKLYRVLKSSLRKIKVLAISHIKERRLGQRDISLTLVNKVRNNLISTMLNDAGHCSPSHLLLDHVSAPHDLSESNQPTDLEDIHPSSDDSRVFVSYEYLRMVFSGLKHMLVRGIRVEAKGRLTRRATASRSVFKMRLKGGLKNIESSFRG